MTFPINTDQPQEHDVALPKHADVVVIGGGIIGVTAAWELAKSGVSVVLLEKGRIAAEQSSRNWGWIRAQGRDLDELPIALEAQRLWTEIAPQLDRDVSLTSVGTVYFAKTEDEVAGYERWLDQAKPFEVSSQVLSASDAQGLIPSAQVKWAGALHTPTDFRAEPWVAVLAIARQAASDGAQIIEHCAVRTLDIAGGRIAGVVTEKGRIAAGAVILAGGAWSSLLLRRHGLSIPQLSVRATVTATEPMDEVFAGCAFGDGIAFRRRADGGYTLAPGTFSEHFLGPDSLRHLRHFRPIYKEDPRAVGIKPFAPKGFPDGWMTPRRWSADQASPFEQMRVLNPKPNRKVVEKIRGDMATMFPHLSGVKIKKAWAGMIDAMPDDVPVVDTADDHIPGLTICTGMCGHGFGIGPAFGRIAARLAMGRATGHDLTRFRLGRFFDKRKLIRSVHL